MPLILTPGRGTGVLVPSRTDTAPRRRRAKRIPGPESITQPSIATLRDPGLTVDPQAFGAGIGEAVADFGQVVKQLDDALEKRNRKIDEEFTATRLSALVQRQTSAALDAQRAAPAGAPGFAADRLKSFDADVAEILKTAPSETARDLFSRRTLRIREAVNRNAELFEFRSGNAHRLARLGQEIDNLGTLSLANPGDYTLHRALLDNILGAASNELTPETMTKMRATAPRRLAENAVQGHIANGDYDAAEAMLEDAVGSIGEDGKVIKAGKVPLTPRQITVLQATIDNRETAEAKAALASVTDDVRDAIKVLEDGYTPDDLQDVLSRVEAAGELVGDKKSAEDLADLASDLSGALKANSVAGRFALLTLPAQEDAINRLEADEPGSVEEVALLKRLKTIRANTEKNLEADALSHGVRVGLIEPPAPVDFRKPETMAARVEAANTVEAHFGAPALPFTAAELDALERTVANADADGRMGLLGSLAAGLDPRHLKRVLTKIAPKQSLFAMAAGIATEDPATARAIIKGADIIKANPKILPPDDSLLRKAFDNVLEDALQAVPQTRGQVINAAMAIYATRSAADNDFSGKLKTGRVKEAVEAVTGGIVEWNGRHVVAPVRGMSEDLLEDIMDALTDADLGHDRGVGPLTKNGGKVTAEALRDTGKLASIADGLYLIEIAGFTASGPDGRPFVLNLKALAPVLARRVREKAEEPEPRPRVTPPAKEFRPEAGIREVGRVTEKGFEELRKRGRKAVKARKKKGTKPDDLEGARQALREADIEPLF